MAFPDDKLGLVVELALGADLTADPATWVWTDISTFCRGKARISGVGRADEQSRATAATLTVIVDNRDGRFVRLNPLSPYYGQLAKDTPIRVTVTDGIIAPSKRFQGFIAELPPRWVGGDDGDQWVPITANGVLRRLDQINIADSALKRFVSSTTKLRTFWPLEDGSDTGLGEQAVSGQLPIRSIGSEPVSWSRYSDLDGASAAAGLSDGAQLRGLASGSSPGSWMVAFWATGELKSGETDGTWASVKIAPRGTGLEWIIAITDTIARVRMHDTETDVTTTPIEVTGLPSMIGEWHSVAFVADGPASGGTVAIGLIVDGESIDTISVPGRDVGAIGHIVVPQAFSPNISSLGVAHIAVWDQIQVTSVDDVWRAVDYHQAGLGYSGETAGARISRLCGEEGIPSTVAEGVTVGDNPASTLMGPQQPGTIASLFHECEDADAGLLYEAPIVGGVGYIARTELYARSAETSSPVMELDNDEGDLQNEFEPDDSDQRLVNDVAASRRGGSTARVSDVGDGELAYGWSVTLNVHSDDVLEDQAAWRVHLGTVDEYRYPVLVIKLQARPELITQWVQCGIGSRITIANPPPGHPPDLLDLLIVGYSEVFDASEWTVRLNCIPASPYRVAKVQGDLTVVDEGFEDASLDVTVTDAGDAAWFRTTDDAYSGEWSFRSGSILASETSDAVVTVPADVSRVRFWYRVSCEPDFDFFRVIVDGSTVLEASGLTPWTQSPYINVSPGNTITFRYAKDSSINRFGDRVYIDDLQFEGGADSTANSIPARVDTAGSEIAAGIDSTATSMVVATDSGRQPWVTIDRGLALSGNSGSYASTPDTAALDIAGDVDLRIELTPDLGWAPGSDMALIAKYDTSTSQRSYMLLLRSDGTLRFNFSTDGATPEGRDSTELVTTVAETGRLAIRAVLNADVGGADHRVDFYTADSIDGAWTKLGLTVTTAGTVALHQGTSPLEVGSRDAGTADFLQGLVHAAEVYDGIDGTLVADPDFADQATGATSFTDSAGLLWTIHGDADLGPVDKFDIEAGGEVMRVEGITGTASPQTFQVVRSINTVVKDQTAGTRVRLDPRHVIAL